MRTVIAILCLVILGASAFLFLRPKPAVVPPAIPAAAPEPAPQATAPHVEPDLILDLFEPTPDSLDAQQAEAQRVAQIEHTLTVMFLLTRCQLITQQDYSDGYNALIHYAVSAQLASTPEEGEQRIRGIAHSAGASYSLIYSRVPCNDPSLPPLVITMKQWRASLAAQAVATPSPR